MENILHFSRFKEEMKERGEPRDWLRPSGRREVEDKDLSDNSLMNKEPDQQSH